MDLIPNWEYVADSVMGGVSSGSLSNEIVAGRRAARLTGSVSLENDGGFLQMAFDINGGQSFDASAYTGLSLDVRGNGETYDLRLRTTDLTRPWQSFRASFQTSPVWRTVRLDFADFCPNKTDATLDPARLRRVGVLAVGRAFDADVAVARIGFAD